MLCLYDPRPKPTDIEMVCCASQVYGSDLYKELEADLSWKWFGLEKLMYCFADTDSQAMIEQAVGVMLVYMWSGYVFIFKWSLEPLFCTGNFWDWDDGGQMIVNRDVAVRLPMLDLRHSSCLTTFFLWISLHDI